MAPHRETPMGAHTKDVNHQQTLTSKLPQQRPSKLSMDSLQRTLSDITSELCKEDHQQQTVITISSTPHQQQVHINNNNHTAPTPLISKEEDTETTEDATCECCGMSEECSQEYITRVRNTYSGKLICGLCAEAVREEMEKTSNGGAKSFCEEEALKEHMSACARFNRIGRAYPVLCQAQAMREIFKSRAKSMSPRSGSGSGSDSYKKSGSVRLQLQNKKAAAAAAGGGITRSSSCIPDIISRDNI